MNHITNPTGWHPISTAPKDGTRILLYPAPTARFPVTGWWNEMYQAWHVDFYGSALSGEYLPEQWAPIPETES